MTAVTSVHARVRRHPEPLILPSPRKIAPHAPLDQVARDVMERVGRKNERGVREAEREMAEAAWHAPAAVCPTSRNHALPTDRDYWASSPD